METSPKPHGVSALGGFVVSGYSFALRPDWAARKRTMIVQVGGKNYEIFGKGWGTPAPFSQLKIDGVPMTQPQFYSLPDADRHTLEAHIKQYNANLSATKASKP